MILHRTQDFIGNYMMTEALATDLQTDATGNFYFTQWTPYKVRGQTAGQFKQLSPLSYVRFSGA